MSAFDNARKFFVACDTPAGWEGCKEYVAEGAEFSAQSEPIADIKTVQAATFHATHSGEGGPVPPTGKETHTHYVYFLTMNDDDKVEKMVKVWNAPWAMTELGWM
jgi:hypothetical protein